MILCKSQTESFSLAFVKKLERNNDAILACTGKSEWIYRVIVHVPMTMLLVLAIERTHAWPVQVGFTRRLCRAEDNPGIVGPLMFAVLDHAGIIVVRCLCAQPAILSRLWCRACRLADAWRILPIPRAHDRTHIHIHIHTHIQNSASPSRKDHHDCATQLPRSYVFRFCFSLLTPDYDRA